MPDDELATSPTDGFPPDPAAPAPSQRDAVAPDEAVSAGADSAAFPIVGVGASAGGLEALQQLLRALPVDTGMAFVVVQHLSPGRKSGLSEILARATKMKVCEVDEACGEPEVEPDHVYVIPPGRDMTIEGGKLRLLPQERTALHRGIDQFFRSLAEDCGHQAIGVVLSGAMSDGTLGLEEIKAGGGITFAQDESAQHDSMPRSAVASGCVDFVLPPEKIAAELARISRHPYVARVPAEAVEEESGHARIAEIVHRATGVDFTHYKTNTLHRRITRRMVLHKLDTLRDYEAHLERVPEEVEALFQDILINVTSFFRDPSAFEVLTRTVFPKLIAGRSRQEPLRIWTLGCSTGEEAYSLAMAYTECAEAAGSDVPLQIFATDLNHVGVGKARAGLYAKSIAQDVSPVRLRRFFVEEDDGFRICKSIRELCIFSRHNVLADPPFSRVDLISCRNLLIYLEPVLQRQIVPLLHYALKPGGCLWLGSSETVGTSRALFEVADARHKIFTRQPGASPPGTRFRSGDGTAPRDLFRGPATVLPEKPRADFPREAERILLAKYTPPGVVISAGMDIIQFRGDTGAYLAPAAGAASLHLLKMLREGLLVGVRAAILRAGGEGRAVREEGLRVACEGGHRELAVEVIPLQSGATSETGFLVLFEEARVVKEEVPAETDGSRETVIRNEELIRLTQELAATREYLQALIEQQEAANEELQSANEEAQSANEEMQSVNEELETSKEEIQSSNEELATVNDELTNRNLDLHRMNEEVKLARDYAEDVVASVRVPLVVLDGALRVKTASRAFYEAFHVTPEVTIGRRIYELGNHQWDIPALRTLLEDILPRESTIDRFEVHHTFPDIGSRIMLVAAKRLSQAIGADALIVLSIEDITERTRGREALLASEARFRTAVGIVSSIVWTNNAQGMMEGEQPGWGGFTGQTQPEYQGFGWAKAVHPEDAQPTIDAWNRAVAEKRMFEFEHRVRRHDGEWRLCSIRSAPLLRGDGTIAEWIGVHTDITDRKRSEEALRESEARKEAILTSALDAIITMDHEGRLMEFNPAAERIFGHAKASVLGRPLAEVIIPGRLRESHTRGLQHYLATGIGPVLNKQIELPALRADGTEFPAELAILAIPGTQPPLFTAFLRDITERKHAEETLRDSENFNRTIIESSPDCIKVLDLAGNLLSMAAGQELLGIEDIAPLLNKPWIDFWEIEEDRAAARAAIAAAASGGEPNFVGFFRTGRGEAKYWNVAVSAIRDASGQIVRLLAVSRDVTARREMEQALVERAEELARADRSKDEFLAMLAHELRNPLAPLRNAAELLKAAGVSDDDRAQAQRIISRQIENMGRMIDDLLDVSRITEGKISLRRKPVALEAILTSAVSLARSGCAAHHQELEVQMPAEPVWLNADATRLEQVFNNLLNNACKYSGDGSHITLSAERVPGSEPPEVVVAVRDDGFGIDPELLPRVFDLFVQASRTLDRAHGGLGIGLTLVSRLVKLHGGHIEAHSDGIGHGAEFMVRLPILREAPAPPVLPPPAPPETSRRILIVDDNTDSARSLAMLQKRRGHETRTAFTGPDAVTAAAEFLPEVVLLDIGLPGMDGFEVARKIRTMPGLKRTFIVGMSGYGSDEDREQGRAAGFDEHLVKPIDLDRLRDWLRSRV